MSKQFITFPLRTACFGLILLFFNNSQAQDVEATIKIQPEKAVAFVEGRIAGNSAPEIRKLSFLLSRGGITGLGARISGVKLWQNGQEVRFRKFSDGEYLADSAFNEFSYAVDLKPKRPTDAAHISWFATDRGVLMRDDLLPQLGESAAVRINFELPDRWAGRSVYDNSQKGVHFLENELFVIGGGWRHKLIAEPGLQLWLQGEWLYTDLEAANLALEILAAYKKVFGENPTGFLPNVAIAKFPGSVAVGNWEAETRGDTVLVLSSDMPFRNQSLQRLHEQLRHELFHLWVPNGLRLKGNYDWFYEGFALYQSLKLAVSLNRIRFEDYLDTLARARLIADATSTRSLIEASQNRFAGSETAIYARGMSIAFLCDLAMLESSGRKRSVEDIIRTVYQKFRNTGFEGDANDAVLGVMNEFVELRPITGRHIKGTEKIDWTPYLLSAGLELDTGGTALLVTAKPNGRQRAMLDKLGYNNWRKLTSPTQ